MSDVALTHYSESLIFDHQKFNFHKTLLLGMYIFEFSHQNSKVFANKRIKCLNFHAKNLNFDRKLNFQNIGKSQFWPISGRKLNSYNFVGILNSK